MFKYSRQREFIKEYLARSKEHPTAERVYEELKPSLPELSLATVYRNLNILVQTGLIDRLWTGEGKDRYDGNTKRHDHFVCKRCEKVYDLAPVSIIGIEDYKSFSDEFQIEDHSLCLYGICGDCSRVPDIKN